jgi:hypothetical protein
LVVRTSWGTVPDWAVADLKVGRVLHVLLLLVGPLRERAD